MNFDNVTEWRIPANGGMKDVLKVTRNNVVLWEKETELDNNYFWIKNLSNNVVRITSTSGTLFYSTNTTNWNTWRSNSNVSYIDIEPNKHYYIRTYSLLKDSPLLSTTNAPSLKIGGNLRKIYYNRETGHDLSIQPHYYQYIFNGNTAIYDASELVITINDTIKNETSSSISLTDNESGWAYCCCGLFKNCTNLVYPPAEMKIPCFTYQGQTGYSTTCYVRAYVQSWESAFEGCTSLIKTPVIKLNAPKVSYKYQTKIMGRTVTITGAEELTNNYITGRQILWYAFKDCSNLNEVHFQCGDIATDFTQTIHGVNYRIKWYDYSDVSVNSPTYSMLTQTANQGTVYIPTGRSSEFTSNMIPSGWTVVEQ